MKTTPFHMIVAGAIAFVSPAAAQTTITPAMLASRGLPIRADTVDGFIGARDQKGYFGFYVYAVSRAPEGRDVLLVTMNYTGRANSSERNFQSDTLAVDAKTLAPLWHRFRARTDSAALTYQGRTVTGWSRINDKYVKIAHELSADAFDAGLGRWIVSSLPFAQGYHAKWTTFSFWSNAEAVSTAAVSGSESVTVGGKSVDAWVLSSPSGTRRWIAKGSGAIVQLHVPSSERGRESWEVKR